MMTVEIDNILKERENGPFTDFVDFVSRMTQFRISEAQLRSLINSGALDCLCDSRASMHASIMAAITYGKLIYDESGQMNIGIGEMPKPKMIKAIDDPLANLENEYNSIGIMLSNNPINFQKEKLEKLDVVSIIDATTELMEQVESEQKIEQKTYKIAGLIRTIKTIYTKKNSTMAFLKIFDETGELEITIFPTLYQEYLQYFEKNNLLIFEGKLEYRNDAIMFTADSISPLED